MHYPEQLTIFITGATDGLGQRVATDLAGMDVTLLLHGRDPDKGRRVLTKIREATQ
jgi:short-subunit dehydrogenase